MRLGVICLSISSDFPTIEYSRKEKPVILPPGCANSPDPGRAGIADIARKRRAREPSAIKLGIGQS
jgi:hypothetical protein